jgi:hypothetical protein
VKANLHSPQAPTSIACTGPCLFIYLFLWRCDPKRVMASSFLRFLYHTQRRTTVGRTPLDKWSARSRDLYLTTHNTHNRQTSMPPVEFKPTTSAGERPQTNALDRAATWTGMFISCKLYISVKHNNLLHKYSYGNMFRLYWDDIRPSKEQNQCIKIYSAFWDPKRFPLQAFGIPEFTINYDTLDLFFRRPDDVSIESKHVVIRIFV